MAYTNNNGQTRIGVRIVPLSVSGTDSDAQAFITAASITDSTQQSAINTLVTQLKTYGIWTKMKALYPMVGGSATSHKFNLKDPRDLDAAYRLVFNGGWVHTSTGALPNGTTAFADTKLKPFGVFNNTTYAHMSYYSRTSSGFNNSEYGMGANDGVNNLAFVFRRANNLQAFVADFSNATYRMALNSTSTDGSGFFVGTQQGANIKLLKQNSLHVSNTTTGTGGIPPNYNVFIGALNSLNVSESFTNKESAFASIGDGLTDAEAANFYTAVQTYQSTLGRNVGTPIVSDADVQAFITAASITDSTQQSAINTLVTQLKTYGIWTKMKALYPFVGGSATSHKFNLKDPRDLNDAFRLIFNGGGIHDSTGYVMNGIDSYANTFFNPSLISGYNDNHSFGLYLKTLTPFGNGWHLGYGNTTTGDPIYGLAVRRNGTNDLIYDSGNYSQNGRIQTTITDAKGFWCGNSRANNDRRIFKNGTEFAQRLSAVIGTTPNDVMTIGAVNGTSGTIKYYLSGINSFTFLASSLSATELTNLNTAVTSFQTTLGRQN